MTVLFEEKELREIHHFMVLGRALDEALDALSTKWRKHWFTSIGEDGVVVGASYGLKKGDVVATHYRGSLTAGLVRGVSLKTQVAACMGTVESHNRGRFRGDVSGSVEHGLIGFFSGNLGPHLTYGTGAAWAMQMRGLNNVAVVTFGDGTIHRGEFHEAANFAAVKKLPVVYVCQNNQFTICSSLNEQTACKTFADRGVGYGMPGYQVDGNDVLATQEVVREAVARARSGDGPTLIDALTYRARGGYGKLERNEQTREEIEEWLKKDPLDRLERKLIDDGVMTGKEIDEIKSKAAQDVLDAVAEAEKGAMPGMDEVDSALIFAPA